MAHLSYLIVLVGFVHIASCDHFNDNVECGPADTACECDAEATVCTFQFYVEHVFTFAKYNTRIPYAMGQGELYYIDDSGNFVSYRGKGKCMEGN